MCLDDMTKEDWRSEDIPSCLPRNIASLSGKSILNIVTRGVTRGITSTTGMYLVKICYFNITNIHYNFISLYK